MVDLTDRLYYKDQYIKSFSATVLKCVRLEKGFGVILDQTAFYPEGGGQPSDTGFIEKAEVSYVFERDGDIMHICSSPLNEGEKVDCGICWERRFLFMQQHSGEHIVSGIIYKYFGFRNVGFHMNTDWVRIDTDGRLTPQDILEIESRANEAVFQNTEISDLCPDAPELEKIDYRSKKELSGSIRIVVIPDADVCACCGLHVKKTGEIGIIKIVSSEAYKGGTRLMLKVGKNALSDYAQKLSAVKDISALLSAKPNETYTAVKRLYDTLNEARLYNHGLKMRLFEYIAEENKGKKAVVFENGLSPGELIKFCDAMILKSRTAAVFSGSDKTGYKYAIGSLFEDAAAESSRLCQKLSGKGGGRGNIISGYVKSTEKEIREYFKEI